MSNRFRRLALAALCLAAAAPLAAQRPDKVKDKGKDPKDQSVAVRVVFHDSDRDFFREYYRTRRAELKPLPPGTAKNLARGKPLPPGIAKTRVPDDVLVRLSWRPRGYTVFLVGDVVVLLDTGGLVADILDRLF